MTLPRKSMISLVYTPYIIACLDVYAESFCVVTITTLETTIISRFIYRLLEAQHNPDNALLR